MGEIRERLKHGVRGRGKNIQLPSCVDKEEVAGIARERFENDAWVKKWRAEWPRLRDEHADREKRMPLSRRYEGRIKIIEKQLYWARKRRAKAAERIRVLQERKFKIKANQKAHRHSMARPAKMNQLQRKLMHRYWMFYRQVVDEMVREASKEIRRQLKSRTPKGVTTITMEEICVGERNETTDSKTGPGAPP